MCLLVEVASSHVSPTLNVAYLKRTVQRTSRLAYCEFSIVSIAAKVSNLYAVVINSSN